MIRTSGRLIISLLAGLLMTMSAIAPAQAEITEGDRSALNDMIRDYILANPEIVREALINLADREEREPSNAARRSKRSEKFLLSSIRARRRRDVRVQVALERRQTRARLAQ